MSISYGYTEIESIQQEILSRISLSISTDSIRLFSFNGISISEKEDLLTIENDPLHWYLFFTTDPSKLTLYKDQEFDYKVCMKVYEIKEKLGSGGYGNVFLVADKKTKEKFAIKLMKNQGSASANLTLWWEVFSLSSMQTKQIVKYFHSFPIFGSSTNGVGIVMEYLEGGSLKEYLLKNKYLAEKESQQILKQIVEGVYFLHCKQMVHWDLKPENIMFSKCDHKEVKIVDFGISGMQNLD